MIPAPFPSFLLSLPPTIQVLTQASSAHLWRRGEEGQQWTQGETQGRTTPTKPGFSIMRVVAL